MASRSSIAALLRRRSAAARLPAAGTREFLSSSANASLSSRSAATAVPAASSPSPATRASPARSILKEIVRGRGEGMAQSAIGGPVRGYHALPASASREPIPTLRGPRARATFSSSSAATAGSSKYDPVEEGIREVKESLEWCIRENKATRMGLIMVAFLGSVCLFKHHHDLEALKHRADKLEEKVVLLEQRIS